VYTFQILSCAVGVVVSGNTNAQFITLFSCLAIILFYYNNSLQVQLALTVILLVIGFTTKYHSCGVPSIALHNLAAFGTVNCIA